MGVRQHCKLREEVSAGDLEDTIFAADFGDLISGSAPKVYKDAKTFFRNTHPARTLCKVLQVVFERLASPNESGAAVRLSTGFGGGKTHTLMAMWHLAENIKDHGTGTDLLPAAGRPAEVHLVGIDCQKAGTPVFLKHKKTETHSLWGEIAWQLGREKALKDLGALDDPEKVPDEEFLSSLFPKGPVLILLDEVVVYMATLSERGQGCLLSFLRKLASIADKRSQTVLVVTDPSHHPAYSKYASQIEKEMAEAATKLGGEFGRTMANFDPIGDEAPRVITRRLFDRIEPGAPQKASAIYMKLYERVSADLPAALPRSARDMAKRIVDCYPFHPRLLDTAQDRLAAIEDFNKSRGTLRLFARILRDLWESKADVELITAGDLDWSSPRIQADLLKRLNRDAFKSAVTADIEKHAAEIDVAPQGIHRRAASALLLESIPFDSNSGMDAAELTLAILRPDEAGHEPGEALERLLGVCWHTYPMAGGRGWQFRYDANINRQIEDRAGKISFEDARSRVMAEAQSYFAGPVFKLVSWPTNASQVSDTPDLQLILCDDAKTAESICANGDDRDPRAPMARRFINSIVAVAPSKGVLANAVERARRLIAADELEREYKSSETHKSMRDQFQKVRPEIHKQFHLQTCRAFDRVILPGGSYPLDEQFQVSEDEMLKRPHGQACVKRFLEAKELIYPAGNALDPARFVRDVLPGATPHADIPGAFTAKAVHERILSTEGLRLIPDTDFSRETIRKAVQAGKLVLRFDDGRTFDRSNCVEGPPGQRKRSSRLLTTITLDDAALVALPEARISQEWLKEDRVQPGGAPTPLQPPPPQGEVHTRDWDEAIKYAKDRPLVTFHLLASLPAGAAQLPSLVPPLSPDRVSLSLTVGGDLKDGGRLDLAIRDVKPTHPLKPLQMAQTIHTALAEGLRFEADCALDFGRTGRAGMESALRKLRDEIPDGVGITATFGRPAKGKA
jgi:hypothetical protein